MVKITVILFLAALSVSSAALQVVDSTSSVDSVSDTLSATPVVADSLDRSVLLQPGGRPPEPQAPPRTSTRKIALTKRHFNYKQQVILAVGMMALIALIMNTTQLMNPK
jgi:hypothetical protein